MIYQIKKIQSISNKNASLLKNRWTQGYVNQELEYIKKNYSEVNNIITEMKNTLKEIKSRLGDTEEDIGDLEDRIMKITHSEQPREKHIKNENRFSIRKYVL